MFFTKRISKSDELNKMQSQLMDFYFSHKRFFEGHLSDSLTITNKKEIIKSIYDNLNYTSLPMLEKPKLSNCFIVYRGITATSECEIKQFVNDFLNGDVFFGKNASLFGTGIYACSNKKLPIKYARPSNDTCGAIIHCVINSDCRMINYCELEHLKESVLMQLKKSYDDEMINQYFSLLEDYGLFAAILGYEAINVPEKEYVVILNREKLFVDTVEFLKIISD